MEKNEIFDNIMARTSVRSYTSQPIEQEKIDILLRAGMTAPSGKIITKRGKFLHGYDNTYIPSFQSLLKKSRI